MKKKWLASLLCAALVMALAPISFAQNTGQISGTATIDGKPMPNTTVRVRNVDNGTIVATGKTDGQGQFSFTGLPAGNYVVEIVSDDGTKLLGTSARVALVAGAMVASGISVGASAAAIGAGVAAGGGSFFASTVGIITIAAIGTGVAAGIVIANDASPSQ